MQVPIRKPGWSSSEQSPPLERGSDKEGEAWCSGLLLFCSSCMSTVTYGLQNLKYSRFLWKNELCEARKHYPSRKGKFS